MATTSTLSQAELLSKLVAVATANTGTASTATDGTITGTLTAIKAKWLLGGPPANHEAHFRESAVESSWGLPPPTFTVVRWDESLSLGKALAGLNAQSKGRRLGIFKPHEEKTKAARERGVQFWIELCGRPVPAKNTADRIRAVSGRAAMNHGRPLMSLRWAYQANVMNTFEQISRSVVWSRTGMAYALTLMRLDEVP